MEQNRGYKFSYNAFAFHETKKMICVYILCLLMQIR